MRAGSQEPSRGSVDIRMVRGGRSRHNGGMKTSVSWSNSVIVCLFILLLPGSAEAQQRDIVLPATQDSGNPYRLEIRVLMRGTATARVQARNWSQLFDKAGHRATIATDNGGESTGIQSVDNRRGKVVEVTGRIDRGVLHLGKKRFRSGDVKALKEFLDQLRKNGVEGPVRQRPTWGLTEEQYREVLTLLGARVGQEIELSSPVEVVEAFRLPKKIRVTWSVQSRQAALTKRQDSDRIDLRLMSTGTGLAVALAQFGLGYRVMENSRGGYDLEIDAGSESDNLWPVGWKNKRSLAAVLPAMYRRVEVDLEDDYVVDILDAVAELVDVSWYCSRHVVTSRGVDIDNIQYSAPPDRESPYQLLDSIAGKHKLGVNIRTDEAGQLVLWCTTAGDQKAWKRRFAHVVPGAAAAE